MTIPTRAALALTALAAISGAHGAPLDLELPGTRPERHDLAAPDVVGYLSGASDDEPALVARAFLDARRTELGLAAYDVADVMVQEAHRSTPSGITHVYLRQRLHGIDIEGADVAVHVASNGRVISLTSSFVPDLAARVVPSVPRLSPLAASAAALKFAAVEAVEPLRVLSHGTAPALVVEVSDGGVLLDPIAARLCYQLLRDGRLRLAWNMVIAPAGARHLWNLRVDAASGAILAADDWIDWDSYRVYPLPAESPGHVVPLPPADSRTLVANPADATGSPYGWHDTNGVAGAEYTITRGNNVWAYEDVSGSNSGTSPSGGAGLLFDFSLNLAGQPSTYQSASIVNLFYLNNMVHDVLYGYGFDEASGNFQSNNYGRGGNAGDYVLAEGQDGGGKNNANFATPADGSRPRMQMYLWDPLPLLVNAPASIAGGYVATYAQFGPAPPTSPGVTASVVLAIDGTAPTSDGCTALVNGGAVSGNIALIDRGTCSFVTKVRNAQNAGAVAVVVANNVPGLLTMADDGTGGDITIPSVCVTQYSGNRLKGALPATNASIAQPGFGPDHDGDLDAGVVIHEYGHGVSNRLVGGRLNVNCLNNQEQAGEGWSDILALMLTVESWDAGPDARGVGTYAQGESASGEGIRDYPYSTDMAIDPRTYDAIKTAAVPHGVGSTWTAMVWEVYWALVTEHGWDPDVKNGSGGNNIAIQLVIEGLKLTACSPGFVDARNAILQADTNLYGGAHQCLIWRAFAKRGLGQSASQGSTGSVTDGTQAFNVPAACALLQAPPDEAAEPGVLTQLTATKGSGTAIAFLYGAACGATSHAVYWGESAGALTSLAWSGRSCMENADGSGTFDPGSATTGSVLYFVVVGANQSGEGSYGRSTAATERPAAGAGVACHAQVLTGNCSN